MSLGGLNSTTLKFSLTPNLPPPKIFDQAHAWKGTPNVPPKNFCKIIMQ